jgi:acyl-CoA reductase-like NAD-dependent aldehyde dehydrogenase
VIVPSLYIDGEWVGSADGTCSLVVNPSDASVVAEVDVATHDRLAAHPGR